MTNIAPLDATTDRTLLCQFGDLIQRDREGSANLLRHLDVIDRRQLWAKLGHPSMFVRVDLAESMKTGRQLR